MLFDNIEDAVHEGFFEMGVGPVTDLGVKVVWSKLNKQLHHVLARRAMTSCRVSDGREKHEYNTLA